MELRTRFLGDGWEAWCHSELFDYENSVTKQYGVTSEDAKRRCLESVKHWRDEINKMLEKEGAE